MSASIYVEPPEAVLFQGTRRLGRGRATLDFAAGDFNPVQVRAELEGYQPQTYQLLPGQAPARLTLRKLPERAPDAAQAGATQAPRPRGTTAPAAPAQAEPAQAEPAGDTPSTKKRKKLGFFE
jgi:hypothetical protein